MGKINWGRVFLGGLLAGVVFGALGAVNLFFFKEDWSAALEHLGRPLEITAGWLVYGSILWLVLGIWAVWLYAAIRPRYGPGPKTAAYAGVALWFICALADAAWASMVPIPIGLLATIVAVYLPVIVVATVAGAWLYKEE